MQKVVSILKKLISSKQDKQDDTEKEIHQSGNEVASESNKGTMDLNNELISSSILNINDIDNIENTHSRDLFESVFNDINNIIVEQLVMFIIKKHDEGTTFNHIWQLIERQILPFHQPSNEILNWLLKNQVKPQDIFLLGVFYFYKICNIEYSRKAFELFSQSSRDNFSIAQVYLAKCYNDGYGVEC